MLQAVLADLNTEAGLERLGVYVLAAGVAVAAALVFVGLQLRKR